MYCAFLQLSVSEDPKPQQYINSDGTVVKKLQLNSQHCFKIVKVVVYLVKRQNITIMFILRA